MYIPAIDDKKSNDIITELERATFEYAQGSCSDSTTLSSAVKKAFPRYFNEHAFD